VTYPTTSRKIKKVVVRIPL